MTKDSAQPIYLADYTPPAFWVDRVELTFRLHPTATRVLSRVAFRPNPDAPGPFTLHGQDLTLIRATIDGNEVTPTLTDDGLTCPAPDAPFVWEAEVEINPEANKALEGLYMSNGMYCTQCEAEGFRKITYYPDRPDVMAPFIVRIESDLPVLLSNGNPAAAGEGWAEWDDPWPKPAYLFALVAGDLHAHRDSFTTASGKPVDLAIWVRDGDQDKCAFGMAALKASMAWDERVYGREYDLDVFNIVAVDDFNAGAMENKGLNVFNSAAVLASPETATDANFERIESIIAHEYFHNWTGNRITCRDWFQLCLKEGLTVYRDQQFTKDVRSEPVKRIDDVLMLRGAQFREDGGPLAHPVRPESFVEINNFYTATVYDKGAEVIGMLHRLVGDATYARALDLYFDRHDGQACTIEDWLKVFEDVSGRDLTQFKLWYSIAGTPHVKVTDTWADGSYTLTFQQSVPDTPGQTDKPPMVIPIAVGLLDTDGTEVVPTRVLELTEARQNFAFDGLATRPVPSILRGFSAPVILEQTVPAEHKRLLLAHDTDPFNRWEAGRALARQALLAMLTDRAAPDPAYLEALQALLADDSLDPAFRALVLRLPSQQDLTQALFDAGQVPDPLAIHDALTAMETAMATHLQADLTASFDAHQVPGPYRPVAADAGKRALANGALALLTRTDAGARAKVQYSDAANMTQQMAALSALQRIGAASDALEHFHSQWQHERLVLDKWFGLQSSLSLPAEAVATVRRLTEHPDFTWENPNRFRAVFGGFSSNLAGFHDPSGDGYALMADWLIRLDRLNPMTTARMTTAFGTWKQYDADRQALMRDALERIALVPVLSRDTKEMVTRILAG
ncbi:aminopeptidase N [Fluviibacterium sp. DFM31]|uniref:Aminopeptidase N n=1 Tax=Meridianimarinicoccus marinus TaxID=3231483 RepID=A0ABV3LAN2_9RHOB